MNKINIAIDGHSSCGKSTMAKWLAQKVGYIYVDTGAMYRAVTLYALRNGLMDKPEVLKQHLSEMTISFTLNAEGKPETYLNGENVEKEIRSLIVSNNVSPIATLPFVRSFLVEQQQAIAQNKGVVMDGRDIGTVVLPDAELKIFVTASAEVRARRRYNEMIAKGDSVSFEDVLKNVQERDYIDSHREVSPLRPAEDAIILDNSNHSVEDDYRWALNTFQTVFHQPFGC